MVFYSDSARISVLLSSVCITVRVSPKIPAGLGSRSVAPSSSPRSTRHPRTLTGTEMAGRGRGGTWGTVCGHRWPRVSDAGDATNRSVACISRSSTITAEVSRRISR